MDLRKFLKKRPLPCSEDSMAKRVKEVPRVESTTTSSVPVPSQEYNEPEDTQLEHSDIPEKNTTMPSTSQGITSCLEATEANEACGKRCAVSKERKLKFQYHWLEKYPWIQYNSTTDGMLCQYCTHIYKEDESVVKHTQGAWISRPVSNWKKALDKMKTHAASDWHKLAKAKYDAERQIQSRTRALLCASTLNQKAKKSTL